MFDITTAKELLPYEVSVTSKDSNNGIQVIFRFHNGYGASVINHDSSYGIELAVIRFKQDDNFDIVYNTSITDDVIGHIESKEELVGYLHRIAALPIREINYEC